MLRLVALFTRAWIEISAIAAPVTVRVSPSSRGRGLKLKPKPYIEYRSESPSSRGRGLKFSRFMTN